MKLFILFVLIAIQTVAYGADVLSDAKLRDVQWHTGQVIAISEMVADPTTFFFEAATGSRFGHIGIVAIIDGKTMVYESDPLLSGVGTEPIENFLSRSRDGNGNFNYTVLDSAQTLSSEQSTALLKAMNDLHKAGPSYNYSQTYQPGSNQFNCAEFVYSAFKNAGLGEYGQVEVIGQAANLGSMNGGLKALDQLSSSSPLPALTAQMISPLSIVKSPNLQVVRTTLPLQNVLNDSDIYNAWDKGLGFVAMMTTPQAQEAGEPDLVGFLQKAVASPDFNTQIKPSLDSLLNGTLLAGGALSKTPFRSFPQTWRIDRAAVTLAARVARSPKIYRDEPKSCGWMFL